MDECTEGGTPPLISPLGPLGDANSPGLEKGGEKFGVSQLEGAHFGPATSHIPAPALSSTTSESPGIPWTGDLCVYIVCLGEGGHGRVHVLGKGVTDFTFVKAADSPSHENPLRGGGHKSKGVQLVSPDNLEGSFCPQCQQIRAGPSKRRPRVPEDQCYKPANAATSLPDGEQGWVGGWDWDQGTWGGIFNFGGHPSVGRPSAFSYC